MSKNLLDYVGLGYFLEKIKTLFVTALGTSGNYLTWTKNGTTNNITVPYATKTGGLSVTSTDNAAVRFDGTSGNVQNSGVTINDSNHVTAAKFITSGGTSSQFVKGDGSLDNKSYIPYGAALLNINPFATNNQFYTSKTDNVLYSASKRYVVTHKYYDSNNNLLGDLQTSRIFEGNYDWAESRVKDNTYAVLYIGKVAEENLSSTTSMLWTYGAGYIFISFYSSMPPLSITAKAYFRAHSSGQVEKWYDKTVTQISPNVWRIDCASGATTYPVAYKITYTGVTHGSYGAALTQVEMYKTRSAINEQSAVTKHPIKQDLWGDVEAPKFIVRGGTSSQFLKADGSVDSTAYGTYSKPSGGIPKTDLASAVQTSLGKADTALLSHLDISGKENTSNKVTSLSSSSTDTLYPSAKCVYDLIKDNCVFIEGNDTYLDF